MEVIQQKGRTPICNSIHTGFSGRTRVSIGADHFAWSISAIITQLQECSPLYECLHLHKVTAHEFPPFAAAQIANAFPHVPLSLYYCYQGNRDVFDAFLRLLHPRKDICVHTDHGFTNYSWISPDATSITLGPEKPSALFYPYHCPFLERMMCFGVPICPGDLSGMNNLKYLCLENVPEEMSLILPPSLVKLSLDNNGKTSLDLSQCSELTMCLRCIPEGVMLQMPKSFNDIRIETDVSVWPAPVADDPFAPPPYANNVTVQQLTYNPRYDLSQLFKNVSVKELAMQVYCDTAIDVLPSCERLRIESSSGGSDEKKIYLTIGTLSRVCPRILEFPGHMRFALPTNWPMGTRLRIWGIRDGDVLAAEDLRRLYPFGSLEIF